jgi:hypothetical protein
LNTSGLEAPGLAGRKVYKLPVLIPPARTLTIEIDAAARSSVGFVDPPNTRRWTGTRSDLYAAIRVENCPTLPPEIGELAAGEHYGHPTFVVVLRDACVPFTVTRDGGRSHRGVVSFGGGDCG